MDKHDFRHVLQQSPFHVRVDAHSQVKNWMSWNGYQTARVFDTLASEYFAIRSSCSVMDMTPMEKYRITGPDALKFLNRLVVRDVSKLKAGHVTYVAWCNDEGRVLDDGTIFHLGEAGYRLCSQHHQFDWLMMSSLGMDVTIEEETHDIAALAVQGPTSCSVLKAAGIDSIEELKPFGILNTVLDGMEVMVSRTGFTGDLGYELWVDPRHAIDLWDVIFGVKKRGLYEVRAIGLDALEMVRIEAGFVMPGDDFNTAESTIRPNHDRSPTELGLDWVVNFDKPYFTGKRALQKEKTRPARRRLHKLSIEGNKLPTDSFLYDSKKGRRIGTIKKTIWSPILKANLAIADIDYVKGQAPKEIWAQIYYQKELEWQVIWAQCFISEKPFWIHPRRLQTPPDSY